jgi:hypothetical protein
VIVTSGRRHFWCFCLCRSSHPTSPAPSRIITLTCYTSLCQCEVVIKIDMCIPSTDEMRALLSEYSNDHSDARGEAFIEIDDAMLFVWMDPRLALDS